VKESFLKNWRGAAWVDGRQTAASYRHRILPHIDTVHVSNCDPGVHRQAMAGVPPKKKSRVPNGKRDFKYWGG
jgi:hypothetical protein